MKQVITTRSIMRTLRCCDPYELLPEGAILEVLDCDEDMVICELDINNQIALFPNEYEVLT